MSDFFIGWRRKLGCVTLLMAVAVTVAWIRSLFIGDWALIRGYEILCQEGRISWVWHPGPSPIADWFISIPLADRPNFIHFDTGVPFWPFAISLTLLSCHLLVSSGRPRHRLPT